MNDRAAESMEEHPARPELPDLEPIRLVGRGAYGEVWLATNKVTCQLVAVKVIRLTSVDASRRADREIAALIHYEAGMREHHENLLAIHHVGQTEDLLFYLMDPADDVRGKSASLEPEYRPATLAARMEAGPIPPTDCQDYAKQLLTGLACLHEAGLSHRDIKPTNCVFVDGKLKLADFGLVTQADNTASMVGTPGYMPPDGRMDARADVYAAGLIIYEMFTGLPLSCFPRWSSEAIEARTEPILGALNRLVLRACQRDPTKRFKDAGDMLTELETLEAKTPSSRSWRRKFLAITATCVLAPLVLIVMWYQMQAPPKVDVNFITKPFEAGIYLDGELAVDPHATPYTTPCTIPRLEARSYRVVFKRNGRADLDVGRINFAEQREVAADWPSDQ